jgi:predicted DNA-binding protein with PD1-like motif
MKTYPSDDGNAAFVSLERGEDLMEGLYRAVDALDIQAGTIQVIGGLEEAVVGYFDPVAAEYVNHQTGHVEICAGLGNVSLKDGKPFIHLHLSLSGKDSAAVGGHAMEGCRAYVVEAYFRKLGGEAPVRQNVEGMTLQVWPGA